ncbi:MAG: hypothetical protein C4532_04610 [Candidatus Abyssobacteria bacterium SURF_17]|uniref:Flagellar protein n=1 Tax=Candidatus Abyssobacteria bacterium SURF_17 TaxID=2093361 RepID=A0A419F4Z1_9BACT|nr:MAG: hypothetical protein C4532_04610 [Candidatus Abyssubacteria bacterium SURF_17]
MRRNLPVVLLVCLLMVASAAWSAHGENARRSSETATDTSPSTVEDRGAGYLPYSDPAPLGSVGLLGAILRAIFSLAIVLGLLYATLWAIRKVMGGSVGPLSEGPLRVVGRIYLSPKAVVYFVKVVDELLVIGTNAGSITLLTTIEDEQRVVQVENALRSAYGTSSGLVFSRFFDKSMVRFQKALDKDDSVFDDQLRGLNEQIGRLRGLTRKRQRDEK